MLRIAIGLLIVTAPVGAARAQSLMADDSPAGFRTAVAPVDAAQQRKPITSGTRFVGRSALGILAWMGGIYGGLVLSNAAFGPYCENCSDHGAWWLYSTVAAGAITTGVTVGAISMRDGCSRRSRMSRALLGSAIGSAGGILLLEHGTRTHQDVEALLAVPLGTVFTSAWLASTCRGAPTNSRPN
jgi:hypothetical protein